jgi:hypothetical protein
VLAARAWPSGGFRAAMGVSPRFNSYSALSERPRCVGLWVCMYECVGVPVGAFTTPALFTRLYACGCECVCGRGRKALFHTGAWFGACCETGASWAIPVLQPVHPQGVAGQACVHAVSAYARWCFADGVFALKGVCTVVLRQLCDVRLHDGATPVA